MHFAPGRHHRNPAAGVFQLAHVARPWQVLQVFLGFRLEQFRLHRQLLGGAAEEMLGQGRNVFATIRQPWNVDADHVQAVEQVLSELARVHQGFQVLVGGGDDAHVHLDRYMAADPVELTIGQYAQQPGLRVGGHIADLVEKQRAAIGLFEAPAAQVGSTGERAFFVAEQLGLHQVLGNRRHVQGDERRSRPGTMAVQSVGDQFFTGAGFTIDQYGYVGVAQTPDGAKHFLHRRGFADDFRGAGQAGHDFQALLLLGVLVGALDQ
ncbi:hypothetical protein D3C84_630740 [compost metagenome]